jgi:hypothetical protein
LAEAEKKKIFDHLNIKDTEHQIQIEKLLTEVLFKIFRLLDYKMRLLRQKISKNYKYTD